MMYPIFEFLVQQWPNLTPEDGRNEKVQPILSSIPPPPSLIHSPHTLFKGGEGLTLPKIPRKGDGKTAEG